MVNLASKSRIPSLNMCAGHSTEPFPPIEKDEPRALLPRGTVPKATMDSDLGAPTDSYSKSTYDKDDVVYYRDGELPALLSCLSENDAGQWLESRILGEAGSSNGRKLYWVSARCSSGVTASLGRTIDILILIAMKK